MSALIRLDAYLPVSVAGRPAFCQHLSVDELAVDLPSDEVLELRSAAAVIVYCADDLAVAAEGEVLSEEAGAPEGMRRWLLRFTTFEGTGREDLVGHLSSLRKTAHLKIAATEDVESATTRAGWNEVRLPHSALPEAHADEDISLESSLLGRSLAVPLLISGMTGGSRKAGEINRRLARLAQELGCALGLGSQRAMLEQPELASTYRVRSLAPDVLLLANLGAVQLNYGVSVDDCRRLVDAIEADVLALHLNPLQEMVQPEGDRDWRDLLRAVGDVVRAVEVPVLVKETGCGIDGPLAAALREEGVQAVDVGGTGGTAWGWIEGFRAADPHRQEIGATFREWGIPTVDALRSCRAALPDDFPLVATGGVRTGLDIARALALGAQAAGMALPFFRAADQSLDEAVALGHRLTEELRIAMFCAGVRDLASLRALEVS
ncbi:MAG: type 2 isopentenyl-diphosphate Delta-isomerase [Myxococcota bacterium]|nr:type 2 isopentenyl-diphosphate Delta-isomerase [Myxococcota bacterium]